ncbi:MAG TPA: adenylosuccinate lyase [Candidatus Izemoplasmatales bacterium]|nr:adenylosuccinate lyase [Candidatus Izemoplasmatales bacterium]
MIERYQRQNMKALWSDSSKLQAMLKVEIANCYAWMKDGLFDEPTYKKILKASINYDRVLEIEKQTRHDVVAFVKAISETLGKEKKWVHYGLTSTDVVDTANALRLKEANKIILEDIDRMMAVLKDKAFAYKNTPIMGRTHGMHAEIMPFGMKFALWFEDFKRIRKHFVSAAKEVEVIKLSGAVGTYSTSKPIIQKLAAQFLKLKASKISTQTLQRDRHANYIASIALIGGELEKIATEVRHLSRSEVGEVSEAFSNKQKGSSAMPHKKNPILSENICGLSRMIKSYASVAFDNIALWHERDISHSSTERMILPDATALIDFMLNRSTRILDQLVVHKKRMIRNIELSKGLYASQQLMNAFVNAGMDRLEMHDYLQQLSRQVEMEGSHLKNVVLADKNLLKILDEQTLDACFSYENAFNYVDEIYHNVFNS